MSEQICEGIWRNRCGQRLVIIRCDPVDGQQWTDGLQHYSDDGTYCVNNRGQDLVVFVGPLPDKSQQDHTAQIERRLAAVTKQNEQAQRYVSDANEAINQKTAENDRLRSEVERLQAEIERLERQSAQCDAGWKNALRTLAERLTENERLQTEIERLRAETQQSEARNTADAEAAEYAARLEGLLDNSREALRELQEDHTEMDHRAEGARSAYLGVIKTLWEMRR